MGLFEGLGWLAEIVMTLYDSRVGLRIPTVLRAGERPTDDQSSVFQVRLGIGRNMSITLHRKYTTKAKVDKNHRDTDVESREMLLEKALVV